MIYLVIIVNKLLQLYTFMIVIYVFGSYFPRWRFQSWYRWVSEFVYPYLNLFRGLPLRMGMMDLTPMVGIIVMQLISMALMSTVIGGSPR